MDKNIESYGFILRLVVRTIILNLLQDLEIGEDYLLEETCEAH